GRARAREPEPVATDAGQCPAVEPERSGADDGRAGKPCTVRCAGPGDGHAAAIAGDDEQSAGWQSGPAGSGPARRDAPADEQAGRDDAAPAGTDERDISPAATTPAGPDVARRAGRGAARTAAAAGRTAAAAAGAWAGARGHGAATGRRVRRRRRSDGPR